MAFSKFWASFVSPMSDYDELPTRKKASFSQRLEQRKGEQPRDINTIKLEEILDQHLDDLLSHCSAFDDAKLIVYLCRHDNISQLIGYLTGVFLAPHLNTEGDWTKATEKLALKYPKAAADLICSPLGQLFIIPTLLSGGHTHIEDKKKDITAAQDTEKSKETKKKKEHKESKFGSFFKRRSSTAGMSTSPSSSSTLVTAMAAKSEEPTASATTPAAATPATPATAPAGTGSSSSSDTVVTIPIPKPPKPFEIEALQKVNDVGSLHICEFFSLLDVYHTIDENANQQQHTADITTTTNNATIPNTETNADTAPETSESETGANTDSEVTADETTPSALQPDESAAASHESEHTSAETATTTAAVGAADTEEASEVKQPVVDAQKGSLLPISSFVMPHYLKVLTALLKLDKHMAVLNYIETEGGPFIDRLLRHIHTDGVNDIIFRLMFYEQPGDSTIKTSTSSSTSNIGGSSSATYYNLNNPSVLASLLPNGETLGNRPTVNKWLAMDFLPKIVDKLEDEESCPNACGFLSIASSFANDSIFKQAVISQPIISRILDKLLKMAAATSTEILESAVIDILDLVLNLLHSVSMDALSEQQRRHQQFGDGSGGSLTVMKSHTDAPQDSDDNPFLDQLDANSPLTQMLSQLIKQQQQGQGRNDDDDDDDDEDVIRSGNNNNDDDDDDDDDLSLTIPSTTKTTANRYEQNNEADEDEDTIVTLNSKQATFSDATKEFVAEVARYLPQIAALLDNAAPQESGPLLTGWGIVNPPVGKTRIKVIEFFACVFTSPFAKYISEQLLMSRALPRMIDLFFTYENNNVLHQLVTRIVASLTSTPCSLFKIALIDECALPAKIMAATCKNDLLEQEKGRKARLCNMGHITQMATALIKLDKPAYLSRLYAYDGWKFYREQIWPAIHYTETEYKVGTGMTAQFPYPSFPSDSMPVQQLSDSNPSYQVPGIGDPIIITDTEPVNNDSPAVQAIVDGVSRFGVDDDEVDLEGALNVVDIDYTADIDSVTVNTSEPPADSQTLEPTTTSEIGTSSQQLPPTTTPSSGDDST